MYGVIFIIVMVDFLMRVRVQLLRQSTLRYISFESQLEGGGGSNYHVTNGISVTHDHIPTDGELVELVLLTLTSGKPTVGSIVYDTMCEIFESPNDR
mmetsp:Transcript_9189/g.10720  ORF Transcript_9189/g.10720 Transcript_9189/m.10720 type:complete len:97 (+) Transcript_9189:75-365(+)